MEARIRKAIQEALATLGVPDTAFTVEWPTDLAHGDFATNVALVAAKPLGRKPQELAEELATQLREALGDAAATVATAGPGFINITLAPTVVRADVERAATDGEWGKGNANIGTRIMIEYSNPNPFKQMHLGHLMGTVIGEAVSRVIENSGATVLRDTYGGDIGPHVAKTLWALRKKEVSDVANAAEVDAAYAHGARAYEESDEAKKEIEELNQVLYAGADPALMDLWHKAREVCLEAFRDLYRLLGTRFDYYLFESETTPIGMHLVEEALARGVFEKSEGAVIYRGEKKGLHTLVFITSHGTPTYETKDIGLAFLKEERSPSDRVYIVTGAEQIGHFKVFLAALEDIAPALAAKTAHIATGILRLTTGKMASRKGNVIPADEFIHEMIRLAAERNPDPLIAEQVGVAAVKYMILRSAPGANIVFDPEQSLSLDGDSGPYLQYALVRAKKLLAYESESAGDVVPETPYAIERLITRFPEVAARAEREHAPHHIAQYLTQLAAAWNAFYATEQVLGSPEERYKQRVAHAFLNTMERGLWLLGIPAPEKM
ncbi:MAG TPA: arginine--tRNA ligase [Candidatus Paceibacterota bacterium]|nr:arginine--tRNA ligase [Candidatus Paceibacterota bacterium]